MFYAVLADALAAFHLAYVAFVVVGELAILAGAAFGCRWARNRWFRGAHLLAIGHPVVGDAAYGGRRKKQLRVSESQRSLGRALRDGLLRQALHASELRFSHPVTGENLAFMRPVPEDFARALEMLRSRDR